MPRIYNKHRKPHPLTAVLCDRTTGMGNPFRLGRDGNRDEVCDKFDEWFPKQPGLVAKAKRELKGKDLLCWCAPARCHCETIMRIANEP